MKNNIEIREKIFKYDLLNYEVAEACGISAPTLCVWFRTEMAEEKKKRVNAAIDRLIYRKKKEGLL